MRTLISRRRRRFRRGIRNHTRGVVSVVGTLLALLVFFALFGVFLTQYVPLWMSENEQALSTQIETALGSLKSGVDGQVANGGPSVTATPIPIASQSIPLIAQPTVATILFIPPSPGTGPYGSVSIQPAPGSTSAKSSFVENNSVGSLVISEPSRYYSPERFSLENDAVIQAQGAGQQVVEFPPSLSINETAGGFGVTEALVLVTGISAEATGSGTQEVFSHFVFSQSFTSANASATVSASIVEGTLFPCAWYTFLNATFANAPASFSSHVTAPTPVPSASCPTTRSTVYPVKFSFSNLASFTLIYAEVKLVVGIGTE